MPGQGLRAKGRLPAWTRPPRKADAGTDQTIGTTGSRVEWRLEGMSGSGTRRAPVPVVRHAGVVVDDFDLLDALETAARQLRLGLDAASLRASKPQ